MGKYIDSDELIREIEDHCQYCKTDDDYTNTVYGMAHDHIVELVKNLARFGIDLEEVGNESQA